MQAVCVDPIEQGYRRKVAQMQEHGSDAMDWDQKWRNRRDLKRRPNIFKNSLPQDQRFLALE